MTCGKLPPNAHMPVSPQDVAVPLCSQMWFGKMLPLAQGERLLGGIIRLIAQISFQETSPCVSFLTVAPFVII